MKADVRIIRLVRKIIRQQPDRTAWDEQEQDLYFATDYFDVMKAEKQEKSWIPFMKIFILSYQNFILVSALQKKSRYYAACKCFFYRSTVKLPRQNWSRYPLLEK